MGRFLDAVQGAILSCRTRSDPDANRWVLSSPRGTFPEPTASPLLRWSEQPAPAPRVLAAAEEALTSAKKKETSSCGTRIVQHRLNPASGPSAVPRSRPPRAAFRVQAFTNILFVVMLAAFSFALCALAGTGEKWLYERHWYRSISPMLEWAYAAGILALHYVGLGGIIGLRAWNAKSFWEALGWRIDGYC